MSIDSIFYLRMSDFASPQRRMDAFPSVKYEVPPTYQSDAISLKYAEDSAATVQVENHAVYLEEGDILLIAPFARHSMHVMRPGGGSLNVVLRPALVKDALPRLFMTANPIRGFLERCVQPGGPLFLHLRCRELAFDREVFAEAAEFCVRHADPGPLEMLLWENRLERALLTLLDYPQIQAQGAELFGVDAGNLSQILDHIQRRLEDVTLTETARALGWNASHLSRYIKQRTGRSFTDIVQVLRLDEASTLMASEGATVEEAMARVGYTGKAHFYALFRQRFGVTPAQYKRQRKNTAD